MARKPHETLARPGVTRLLEFVQRHKAPMCLGDAKRVPENCETSGLGKPRFLWPHGCDLIRSSKPWERLSINTVGPKPMTRSKNQNILTVLDEFNRFLFAFPLRPIMSSSVVKCLSTLFAIFGTPMFIHFKRGTQFDSTNSKPSAAKMEVRPPKLRTTILKTMVKTSAARELFGRPFSACYTPRTAHYPTGKVFYHQRSLRSEH